MGDGVGKGYLDDFLESWESQGKGKGVYILGREDGKLRCLDRGVYCIY